MEAKSFIDNLPDDCVVLLLNHISYHEISQLRMVNKRLDRLCSNALNAGFRKFRQLHESCLKQLKDSLPKRESERIKHRLNLRHTMLLAIDTRVSLLAMTYHRYIMDGIICFIPGKVLDELFRVLRIIEDQDQPVHYGGPGKVGLLQELRDLSSMAIEHFDDHIGPTISAFEATQKTSCKTGNVKRFSGFLGCTVYDDTTKSTNLERVVSVLKKKINVQECSLNCLKSKLKSQKNSIKSLQTSSFEQEGRITEMSKQLMAMQRFLKLPDRDNTASSSGEKRKFLPEDPVAFPKKIKIVKSCVTLESVSEPSAIEP